MSSYCQIKKGMILVLSLWTLAFLTVFAVYLGRGARQKLTVLRRVSERDALRLVAAAGIKEAQLQISRDTTITFDSFSDGFLMNEEAFKDITVGKGSYTVSYPLKEQGKEITVYGAIDEARKINLNTVDRKVLGRLFDEVLDIGKSASQNLAASIVDFRDEDSQLSIPVGSAEDSYYRNLREPYDCKDAPFESPQELLLVNGMSEDIFEKLKDFVTIYSVGAVNINTASREVLGALSMGERLIDKIMAFRLGKDKEPGTLDDNVFTSPGSITAQLSQKYSLGLDEATLLSNLIAGNMLTTSSEAFTIRSRAALSYAKGTYTVICVCTRKGETLYWREQ